MLKRRKDRPVPLRSFSVQVEHRPSAQVDAPMAQAAVGAGAPMV